MKKPEPPANVTLDVLAGRVNRLNHRCKLMGRQIEILCDAMLHIIESNQNRALLEHLKILRVIEHRYVDETEACKHG